MLTTAALVLSLNVAVAAKPPPAVVIWGGGKTKPDAERSLARWKALPGGAELALAEGYPRIVESGTWKGLRPGFFVVVLGVCSARDTAGVVRRLKPDNPGVYARSAPGLDEPLACPRLTRRKTVNPKSRRQAEQHPVLRVEGFLGSDAPAVVSAAPFGETLLPIFKKDTAVLVGWDTCAGEQTPEEEALANCASGEEVRIYRGQRLVLQLPRAADASDVECSVSLALRDLKARARNKGEPPAIIATYDWSDGGCAALYARDGCMSGEEEDQEACLEALPADQRVDVATYVWKDGAYVQESWEEDSTSP